SSTHYSCDQDRHLMSAAAASAVHHPALTPRSSTGHAGARPNRAPALISMQKPSRSCPLFVIKQTRLDAATATVIPTLKLNSIAATLTTNESPSGKQAAALHIPRVRSLEAFGRRPQC